MDIDDPFRAGHLQSHILFYNPVVGLHVNYHLLQKEVPLKKTG